MAFRQERQGPTLVQRSAPIGGWARKYAWLLAFALLWLPGSAWAAARIHVEVSTRRLAVDEELQLTVQTAGDYDELTAPLSDGFDFRQAGRQTQVQIVNGDVAHVETYVFVGTPRRAGRFTLDPISLSNDGREVARSQPVAIEVVADSAPAGPAEPIATATDLRRYAGEPFFVRPSISVLQPFAGQQFVLTFELYWRPQQIRGIGGTATPRWGSLQIEELDPKASHEREMAEIDGHPYQRQITHQVLAVAPEPGSVRVDGPAYRIEAGDVFETRTLKLLSRPVAIPVRAIPEAGRPASFREGQVGRLRLSAHLGQPGVAGPDVREVQIGERLLLTYQVEGEGNLLGLRELRPKTLPGMTVEPLPGRGDSGVRRGPSGTEGTRTWQSVLSFAKPGRYEVPALEFTAFDPQDEKFVTSSAGPFTIVVRGEAQPGTNGTDTAQIGGEAGRRAVSASQQLRPIAAEARLSQEDHREWTAGVWFRTVAVAPWAASLLLLGWRVVDRRRRRQDPARLRVHALRDARARMEAAAALGPDRGYADLREAVAAYLERTTGMQAAGLTEHALSSRLKALGAEESAVDSLLVQLQHCDFARFAPSGDRGGDLQQTAARIAEVLGRLDVVLVQAEGRATRANTAALWLVAIGTALLLGTGLALPARAATLDEGFASANQAYVEGRLQEARQAFLALLQHDLPVPALHYNLANTLVREKRLGEAVGHYLQALRQEPDDALRTDIQHNLSAVRSELADRARQRHATLHIFDESPELDVALARAAPRTLLGLLALLGGWGAVILLGVQVLRRGGERGGAAVWSGVALCAGLHLVSLGWLWHAQHTDATVNHAVVIQEDAALAACQGVGDTIGLPEGLEVRKLATLADGRVEVRLPNGRQGCLAPTELAASARLTGSHRNR